MTYCNDGVNAYAAARAFVAPSRRRRRPAAYTAVTPVTRTGMGEVEQEKWRLVRRIKWEISISF